MIEECVHGYIRNSISVLMKFSGKLSFLLRLRGDVTSYRVHLSNSAGSCLFSDFLGHSIGSSVCEGPWWSQLERGLASSGRWCLYFWSHEIALILVAPRALETGAAE